MLEMIPAKGITVTAIVASVLQFLLMHPKCAETDFSSLRLIAYGGSPIPSEVLRNAITTFGCGFLQMYGMTEACGAVAALLPEDHDPDGPPERLLSCGRPYPWVELRIVEPESRQDLAPGEPGEIWVRSKQVMAGYWHQPEATAQTITDSGWLRTGDLGSVDANGYVYLHDRVNDMIISGGENVYPAEVENTLMDHPAVADAAAIGIPDERWGETVKGVIVTKPGETVAADEIIAFCRERMAHYKCPTSVDVVEALPRNASGKVLRRELREPYWQGRTRRVN
jgi:acyl-CoA synthetase (AMP-forming)/AMP-acid ligase II